MTLGTGFDGRPEVYSHLSHPNSMIQSVIPGKDAQAQCEALYNGAGLYNIVLKYDNISIFIFQFQFQAMRNDTYG